MSDDTLLRHICITVEKESTKPSLSMGGESGELFAAKGGGGKPFSAMILQYHVLPVS